MADEPVRDGAQAQHAAARLAAARELVSGVGEAHELGRDPSHASQDREELFGLIDRTAEVAFAVLDEQRRCDRLRGAHRGTVEESRSAVVGEARVQLAFEKPADVRRADHAHVVVHRARAPSRMESTSAASIPPQSPRIASAYACPYDCDPRGLPYATA